MDIVGDNLRRLRARPPPDRLAQAFGAAAAPLSRAYEWLGSAPPAIDLQVLLVTLPALWGLSGATWPATLAVAGAVAAGHLLLHAGRLLAQRRGVTAWTILLERFTRRVQEAALLVAAWWMEGHPVARFPGWLPDPWRPLGPDGASALMLGALAAILAHHALDGLHDVLVLRTHLATARRAPGPTVLDRPPRRRLAPPADLPVAAWLAACLVQQWQACALALAALYGAAAVATLFRFRSRTLAGRVESEASRILGPDYL